MGFLLAENLKKRRKQMGLTQKNVADILNLERSTYAYYETGKTFPSIDTLVKLSSMFDTSLEGLLGIETRRSVLLGEEPDFSFKDEAEMSESSTTKRLLTKMAELTEDELLNVEDFVDKLIKTR